MLRASKATPQGGQDQESALKQDSSCNRNKFLSFFLSFFFNTLKQHRFQTGQVRTETSLHRKRMSVFPTPLPGPS